MNRNLFAALTFASLVYLIVVAFQTILLAHFDNDLYRLPSFLPWLAVAFGTSLIWLAAVSVYHYVSGHRFTLMVSIVQVLVMITRFYILYTVFSSGKYLNLYFSSYFLVLSTGLLYGLSLLFSNAARHRWLRIAGMYSSAMATTLILTLIIYLCTDNVATKALFEQIHNKLAWFSELPVLLFLVNWYRVWRKPNGVQDVGKVAAPVSVSMIIGCVGCLVFGGYVGKNLLSEKPMAGPREAAASNQDKAYAKRFEARTFVSEKGDTLLYRLMKPMHYDSTKAYPLVLCLHGGAGWGTDNIKQVFGALPAVMLSNYAVREKYPAFLVVPQISSAYSWGGIPNLQVADQPAMELLTTLQSEFHVDKQRIYVAGNSLGGYGAWYFIGKHPKVFAAAIPISGAGDTALAQAMSGVPVWAFHGAKDINVPVDGSRRMISALQKAGASPKYSEYPDADHGIWKRVVNTPELLDWLFAQKRSD